jgi:hypothetical protein
MKEVYQNCDFRAFLCSQDFFVYDGNPFLLNLVVSVHLCEEMVGVSMTGLIGSDAVNDVFEGGVLFQVVILDSLL